MKMPSWKSRVVLGISVITPLWTPQQFYMCIAASAKRCW